jgi:hypothetical protein
MIPLEILLLITQTVFFPVFIFAQFIILFFPVFIISAYPPLHSYIPPRLHSSSLAFHRTLSPSHSFSFSISLFLHRTLSPLTLSPSHPSHPSHSSPSHSSSVLHRTPPTFIHCFLQAYSSVTGPRSYFPEPNHWPSFTTFWNDLFTTKSYWHRYNDFYWWFWLLEAYWFLIFAASLHLTFICIYMRASLSYCLSFALLLLSLFLSLSSPSLLSSLSSCLSFLLSLFSSLSSLSSLPPSSRNKKKLLTKNADASKVMPLFSPVVAYYWLIKRVFAGRLWGFYRLLLIKPTKWCYRHRKTLGT